MKPNVGTIDKFVRIGAAVLIAVLYFANVISGTMALILMVLAAVFLITGLVNFCPLYSIFGYSTRAKQEEPKQPVQPAQPK